MTFTCSLSRDAPTARSAAAVGALPAHSVPARRAVCVAAVATADPGGAVGCGHRRLPDRERRQELLAGRAALTAARIGFPALRGLQGPRDARETSHLDRYGPIEAIANNESVIRRAAGSNIQERGQLFFVSRLKNVFSPVA